MSFEDSTYDFLKRLHPEARASLPTTTCALVIDTLYGLSYLWACVEEEQSVLRSRQADRSLTHGDIDDLKPFRGLYGLNRATVHMLPLSSLNYPMIVVWTNQEFQSAQEALRAWEVLHQRTFLTHEQVERVGQASTNEDILRLLDPHMQNFEFWEIP